MTDVIVSAKSFSHEIFWGFSVSRTGQLDFEGKIAAPSAAELAKMQRIEPSGYFSPSWYSYLPEIMQSKITVFAKNSVKFEDQDLFSYILHIGALLLAVEAKESLLAAELFDRRSYVFMKFHPITAYILEDIAPEMLFAWEFGRFSDGSEPFAKGYHITSDDKSTTAKLFKIAEKKLCGENMFPRGQFAFIFLIEIMVEIAPQRAAAQQLPVQIKRIAVVGGKRQMKMCR